MPIHIKVFIILVCIIFILFILTRIGLFSGTRPLNLGVIEGRLQQCPVTPNCVSTFAEDAEHGIQPLPLTGSLIQEQDKILSIIRSFSRTNIVVNEPGYIYVEFRTAMMRYTDDVEFMFDERAGYIHFRSASRLGMSDLGLNRRRMEQIREKWLLLH